MKIKLNILLIPVCLSIWTQKLKAEDASLYGRVLDENNSPVLYATVILKSAADSSIYKGEITDESGEYIFQKIEKGEYILQVQSVGYSTRNIPGIVTDADPLKIDVTLSPASEDLKAVNIVGEKPFIERQTDKMVVNVENSIIQAGSTVMEVFEKLPGVIVDQDGNIRLRGKQGVIVMIDGRPTTLSGQDLVNMLRGMSASNIQKIEIISNPSAKWDASGNAGILNIVMKKNRLNGFNGNANVTYGQGRYPKFNSSLSLNYKKEKMNLFFNYSYSKRKFFNNLILDRKFYNNGELNENYLTNNYIIIPILSHNAHFGVDYSVSEKTTVSVLATAFSNNYKPATDNHTDILGSGVSTGALDFAQESDIRTTNYEFNTQINHQFDSAGQSLIVNLDYGIYENNSEQYYTTLYTDHINNTFQNIYLFSDQDGLLYLYSAKADYSKPLKNEISFEAGLKSSYVQSDMDMRFYNSLDDASMIDSARSSHFIYNENINASYVSVQKQFNALTVQAGLRAEHTVADGLQRLNNNSFNRNYFQVFPTLFINYEIGKSNINANLGRRINRPAYNQMNPFRRMIDYTTYSEGNPFLLPELTYLTELSYSYDNTYFVTLNYSHTADNITDILIQDYDTRTTIQSVVNLNELNYYSVDLTYSKRILKWWKTSSDFLGYYSRFIGTVNDLSINQGKPSFSVNSTNSFSINDDLSAELSIQFNYTNLYGVTTMSNSLNVTAGLQQSVLGKRGIITMNLTDIFWTAYPSGFTDFDNVTEDWVSKRDTRVLNIGFTYNFGKGKLSKIRKSTGADEEKGRIQ